MAEFEQGWQARQERAVFTLEALKEAARNREALGPSVESTISNSIEEAMVSASHFQTTAAMLQGETEDEDDSFAALAAQAKVELRTVEEGDVEILTGFGPAPGGLLKWVLRFVGISYLLDKLGLPTPVMDLLQMAGESLGLESLAGKLPFIGESQVVIYWNGKLMGDLDLSSWADFRSSMKRSVWGHIRVRAFDASPNWDSV